MSNKTLFIIIGALIVVVAGGAIAYNKKSGGDTVVAGVYDGFAQCLTTNGAKFYGAFWCSHCQNQKKAFGASVKYLPYVECATPDGQGQTPACADAKITGYPTWVFADGQTASGEQSMEKLAELSKCTLPTVVK
jgi:hypothetical protein